MSDTADDWAIVVGINDYVCSCWKGCCCGCAGCNNCNSRLGCLEGAENDATYVLEWLSAKGLPEQQVKSILSSHIAASDQPGPDDIQRAFHGLYIQSRERLEEHGTPRVGRRLYFFMSGHGIQVYLGQYQPQTALLTANATRDVPNHFSVLSYAEYVRNAGIFDEVMVMLDCCRCEGCRDIPSDEPLYPRGFDQQAKKDYFYGFATQSGATAREVKSGESGEVRGNFTRILLEGLSGGCPQPITTESLANYVKNRFDLEVDGPAPDFKYDTPFEL